MYKSILFITTLIWSLAFDNAVAQVYHGPVDQRINTELVLDVPSNGVSTTPGGRLFLVYARVDGSTGPQVVGI